MANWIDGIPAIYYPWGLQSIAIRFKNSLQENAKTHAIVEDVIESGHNGIVSWEKPSDMVPVMIEGTDDHTKTKERWEILRTVLLMSIIFNTKRFYSRWWNFIKNYVPNFHA